VLHLAWQQEGGFRDGPGVMVPLADLFSVPSRIFCLDWEVQVRQASRGTKRTRFKVLKPHQNSQFSVSSSIFNN
jgi:hypothetical protein